MPARRSSAAAQVQEEADIELEQDAPTKIRPIRSVPKSTQTQPKAAPAKTKAKAKKSAPAKEPVKKGPEFKKLTAAAVRPKAFRSTMLPLESIGGWEGGDPPPDDFVDDIRKNGLEVPIVVDPEEDGSFTIVEGKRRIKAFQVLTDEGIEGFAAIPAVTNPRRNQRDIGLRSLSANYQRGENITGDASTVKSLMDAGYNEKQIAEASNTPIETVRALRNIAFRLHPVLFKATEQNKMKPWAAKQAAQLKEEGQARLLVQLEKNGRVTTDDVIEARRFRVIQAADSVLPREMFDAEADIPYDDEGDELEAAGAVANRTQNVVATPERVGKRLSEADHKFNAIRGATVAKVSLGKIKKLTENERQALDAIEEALHFLEDEDENVLAIAAVDTALEDGDEEDEEDEEDTDDEESDDDEELDDEEADDEDEEEEEEEFDDEEEEEDQPF